jgi:hypothetical protein
MMTGPPRLLVVFAVEEVPRVVMDAMNDGEEARLVDWLTAHPQIARLVDDARALAREQRAA